MAVTKPTVPPAPHDGMDCTPPPYYAITSVSSVELPNIAAYAYQDVHVWSALLTCAPPPPPRRHGSKGTERGVLWALSGCEGHPCW